MSHLRGRKQLAGEWTVSEKEMEEEKLLAELFRG
jgi:hypothetical protein